MDLQTIFKAVPEILTQLLTFLIVLWILKKFAFKPILRIMDQRRKVIEDSFSDIERKKQEIANLEKEYRQRLEHIDQEARVKIQEAANVGVALARDIQDKARHDAQKLIDRAKSEIDQDIEKAKLGFRDDIVTLSSLMTEKILREKIDAREHEKLVDKFIKDLEKVE